MSAIDELKRLLDGFEHECYMLRVEASETRAKDEAVRDAYERIRENAARAIAATLGDDREKRLEKLVRIYGEIANYFCERFACCDADFANCKYCIGLPQGGQCELGWCNDESKALGIEQSDYGGGECEPVNLQELYDKLGELENELATLGGGECEKLPQLSDTVCIVKRGGVEMKFGYWRCSECGCENFEGAKHCMNCGRKAVEL